MVVRDREGRQRYVAIVVTPPVDRKELLAALRGAPSRVFLAEYEAGHGLVRCAHTAQAETVAFLNSLTAAGAHVRTLGTSGTMRKAREKFLVERGSRDSSE